MLTSRVETFVDVDEAERLLQSAYGSGFEALLSRASQMRDSRFAGGADAPTITYSRKVFIPLTTLCRDRCHYCTFVDTPAQLRKKRSAPYMSKERVLAVARQGAALGCKEALLTLGDRPEARWPEARQWLDEHGYASTIDYVVAMARAITRETGLLAHANPGVMTRPEIRALREVSPSMGMMLETTSRRLFETPGEVHFGSPDKDPAVRLDVIDAAGELDVPFTTGILIGIGETIRERAESIVALRDLHERHGHIQEVIIQNFRAKPQTAMRAVPDADDREYLAAIAVARLVFGPEMRIQVPPNLTDPSGISQLLDAGADDWGGVSPLTIDHVNPERPWPHLTDLAEMTAGAGFQLRERLTAQPAFIHQRRRWIDPHLHPQIEQLADPDSGLAAVAPHGGVRAPEPVRASDTVHLPVTHHLVRRAAEDPDSLDDDGWIRLLRATGSELTELTRAADDTRRYTVGEAVSLVANRNLDSSRVRLTRARSTDTISLEDVEAITRDAWDLGATEVCAQGVTDATEDPAVYLALARAVKRAQPRMHLHAFRPQDIADLADRGSFSIDEALRGLRDAGVDTIPGTGVKILDETLRPHLGPSDLPVARWRDIIESAHRFGFRSSSVIFYGGAETAAHRVSHLRTLADIQRAAASRGQKGFTEIVPIPGGQVPLVEGRDALDEHRAMFAVTRLMLNSSIAHVQVPWTRLGLDAAAEMLGCGADDLGGTLFDGRIHPDAGVEHGLELPVRTATRLTGRLFRPLRQRASDYTEPVREQRPRWR